MGVDDADTPCQRVRMNREDSTYGAYIARRRSSVGLTLVKVAGAVGVSVAYLHDVEHGRRGPLGADREAKLVDVLGADPERLRVLAAMARARVDVGGLDEAAVGELLRQVERMRSDRGGSRG